MKLPVPIRRLPAVLIAAAVLLAGVAVAEGPPSPPPPPPPGISEPPATPQIAGASAEEYNAGLEAANAGDYKTAKAKFEAAVKGAPDFAPAHYNLAIVLKNLNELAASAKEFRKALELDPENTTAPRLLAEVLLSQADYKGAVPILKRAIVADSTSIDLYYALALSIERSVGADSAQEVIGAWRQALRKGPKESGAYAAASTIGRLSLRLGDENGAVQAYQQAARIEPKNPEPYYNQAVVLNKMGKYKQAINALEKAVALKDPYGQAQYLMAAIYYSNLQDDAQAIEHYTKAAQDPSFSKRAQAAESAKKIQEYLDKKKAQQEQQEGGGE